MSSNNDIHFEANTLQKTSALLIPCFAYVAVLGVPITFTGMIETFAITPSQATIASTAEIAFIALASIGISVVLGVMNRKTLYALGILLAILGQIGTLISEQFSYAVIFRGIAGMGEGVCIGLGFASLAQFRGGTRLLGISSAISAAVTLSAFLLVPTLHGMLGSRAIFWALAFGYTVMLPLAFALPNISPIQHADSPSPLASLNVRSVSLFILCLLSSIGANTLWLYFEQVGQQAGFDFASIGIVGSVSMLCSVLVSWVANKVFERFRNVLPLLIACLLMAVTSYLYVKPSVAVYWSVGIAMTFLYVFLLAYARMYSSDIDSSGRTTAAASGADSLGMLVGPLIVAATLRLDAGYGPLGEFGVIMQLLCLIPAAAIFFSKTRTIHAART